MKPLTREQFDRVTSRPMPPLKVLKVSTITQSGITAFPKNAEARDYPALLADECQTVADTYGLPVSFSGPCGDHTVFFPHIQEKTLDQ